MPRFFLDNTDADFGSGIISIKGGDASHIVKALRMKAGDTLTVCDCRGSDYSCEILEADPLMVPLKIIGRHRSVSEPTIAVTLYQGLPKSDKMDFIVQKSVELGVTKIVPVITLRSVSRPDKKSLGHKTERWNRISDEAAKQCGRGILPEVAPAVDFNAAIALMAAHDLAIMPYEQNGGSIHECLDKIDFSQKENAAPFSVGVIIGPEGGFDEKEADYARSCGVATVGMGPRILRTETAPLCALSALMYASGNL